MRQDRSRKSKQSFSHNSEYYATDWFDAQKNRKNWPTSYIGCYCRASMTDSAASNNRLGGLRYYARALAYEHRILSLQKAHPTKQKSYCKPNTSGYIQTTIIPLNWQPASSYKQPHCSQRSPSKQRKQLQIFSLPRLEHAQKVFQKNYSLLANHRKVCKKNTMSTWQSVENLKLCYHTDHKARLHFSSRKEKHTTAPIYWLNLCTKTRSYYLSIPDGILLGNFSQKASQPKQTPNCFCELRIAVTPHRRSAPTVILIE